MTALSRSVTEPHVRRRGFSFYAVSGLVVCAAIVGLVIGGLAVGGGDPPTSRTGTPSQATVHEGVRLQVPRGWARGDVVKVPGFKRPLGLRNADAGLRAVVERLPATSATLLPAAFLATLERAPERPEVVRLSAGRQAWRYRFPGRDGSMTLFYAAPTTDGIATVACTSPLDASIPRECAALAAAVTVPGSRPLEPGASAAFYSRLPSVVGELDPARGRGLSELRAATRARAQALAAGGLARAHNTAGATLAPLVGNRDGAPAATAGALTAAGAAYSALSRAARARSPRRYANARRAVTGAEADLRRTMTTATAAVAAATRGSDRGAKAPVRAPVAAKKPAVATKKPATAEKKPAVSSKQPSTAENKKPAAAEKKPATAEKKPATDEKPSSSAKRPSAARSAVEAPAKARPAATAAGGADLTLLILALSGAVALIFVVRGAVRALR